MPRFRHYNYDHGAMVVIDYQEQLQAGAVEYAVHYPIEHKLDLSVFHQFCNFGGRRIHVRTLRSQGLTHSMRDPLMIDIRSPWPIFKGCELQAPFS